MENTNINILIGLMIGIFALCAYIYVSIRQAIETYLIRDDGLYTLRLLLLTMLSITMVGIVPGLVYQWLRLRGLESEMLRTIANISAQTSRLSTAVLLVLVYRYRKDR